MAELIGHLMIAISLPRSPVYWVTLRPIMMLMMMRMIMMIAAMADDDDDDG